MTTPSTEYERRTICCGPGDAWAPKEGSALVLGCATCPRSASFWRLPENREDGQRYVPVLPLGEVST